MTITAGGTVGSVSSSPLPSPPHGRPIVVVAAGVWWDGIQLVEQNVSRVLSDRSTVLYVEPPVSPLEVRRNSSLVRSRRELVEVSDSLYRLTRITVPGVTRPLFSTIARRQLRSATAEAVAQLGGRVRASITFSPVYSLWGVGGAGTKVYYATDDYSAGARLMGVERRWLDRRQRRLLAQADVVAASSEVIARRLRPLGCDPLVIPNGVDVAAYDSVSTSPVPTDVLLEPPVVTLLGQINERIDLELLQAVAERGLPLLLVGPVHPRVRVTESWRRLEAFENVQAIGQRPFDTLSSYLRITRVGLVPYADSDFNRASFPLKMLEYLAAGRAVVSTDLPAARWLDTDLVRLARGPAQFAEEVESALAEDETEQDERRRRAFAAEHDWAARLEPLTGLLGIEPQAGRS